MEDAILRKKGEYQEVRKIEGKIYRVVAMSNKLIGVEEGKFIGFYEGISEE